MPVLIALWGLGFAQEGSVSATLLSNPLGQFGVRLEGRYAQYLSDNLELGARLRLESNPLGERFRARLTPFVNYSAWLVREDRLEASGFAGLETPLAYTTLATENFTFGLLTFAGVASEYRLTETFDFESGATFEAEWLPTPEVRLIPFARLEYALEDVQLYLGSELTLLKNPTTYDLYVGSDIGLDAATDLRLRVGYSGSFYALVRYRFSF